MFSQVSVCPGVHPGYPSPRCTPLQWIHFRQVPPSSWCSSPPPPPPEDRRSTGGRYVSYSNAFLFHCEITNSMFNMIRWQWLQYLERDVVIFYTCAFTLKCQWQVLVHTGFTSVSENKYKNCCPNTNESFPKFCSNALKLVSVHTEKKRTQTQQHGSQTGFHKFWVISTLSGDRDKRNVGCCVRFRFHFGTVNWTMLPAAAPSVVTWGNTTTRGYKNKTSYFTKWRHKTFHNIFHQRRKISLKQNSSCSNSREKWEILMPRVEANIFVCTFIGAEDRDVSSPAAIAGGPAGLPWAAANTAPPAALGPPGLGHNHRATGTSSTSLTEKVPRTTVQ